MANQLKVGMIGCGGISASHMPNILKTPEIRLIATMDLVEEGERSNGRRFGARVRAEEGSAEYYTDDLDRVLTDPDIDAVLVFTTHDTHADIVVKACEAGKHIFVEKPLAMTLDEAQRIQKAVHDSGVKLMSGWWFKHSPITKRLREVIPQPYFALFLCQVTDAKNPLPDGSDGLYGVGGLLDNAGYNPHWIWHVMRSQPIEVFAMGYEGRPTNTSTILIRFANGGVANSVFSTVGTGGALPKHYAEALGGSVSASTMRFGNLVFEGTDEPGIEENAYLNGFNEEMGMFARLCLEGGPSPMDAWEAAIPTLIFETAIESMRTRRPVPVNIKEAFYNPNGKVSRSIVSFGDL